MLAGRKLLLADDSITIQKVVDLTFADEGVKVISVSNGREAIERLEDIAPDIVLADVSMPEISGYEVCEYIKNNEKLNHIPVMLLVGSFEPFDEAEARRVGADDTLTKPFQSIRRLIDKVGALMGGHPTQGESSATELPEPEAPEPQTYRLSAQEIEITTADTQPFAKQEPAAQPGLGRPIDQHSGETETWQGFATDKNPDDGGVYMPVAEVQGEAPTFERTTEPVLESPKGVSVPAEIYSPVTELRKEGFTTNGADHSGAELRSGAAVDSESGGDVLLDLGDFEPSPVATVDEFVLDLDFDAAFRHSLAESSAASAATVFVETEVSRARVVEWDVVKREPVDPTGAVGGFEHTSAESQFSDASFGREPTTSLGGQMATTQEWMRVSDEGQQAPSAPVAAAEVPHEDPGTSETIGATGQIRLDQLSPEVIDAIARRAVEYLSEKVVQEIAWEVVPQLAELLIKRKLEERESQAR